jgi:ankyrin repeat protein
MSTINIESLRKQAKALLKLCRSGDAAALARMRAQLPRLGDAIKLADVHHALARELGYANWAGLKLADQPLAQFLAAVRGLAFRPEELNIADYSDFAEDSIHAACVVGDVDAVRYHVNQNPALVNTLFDGWTPLLYAAGSPFARLGLRYAVDIRKCAEFLLDHGADPNAADPESNVTAAARAFLANNRLMILLLAQRGVPTPGPGIEAVRDRIFKRADAGPVTQAFKALQQNPEYVAEMRSRLQTLRQHRPEFPPISQMTIKDMLEVEKSHVPGTPDSALLSWESALKYGFDPNLRGDRNGETMLHAFAMRNDSTGEALVRLFLERGADPNALTHEGRTPYALAIRAGNTDAAELLLKAGAREDSAEPVDRFIGACRRNSPEAAEILTAHPEVLSLAEHECRELLAGAAKSNQFELVWLLADLGVDLAASVDRGATAMHIASWHGHVEIVRTLIERGAPVNAQDAIFQTSPLAWAAHGSANWVYANEENYLEIAKLLLEAGAEKEPAVNRWNVAPEDVAIPNVAAFIRSRWH